MKQIVAYNKRISSPPATYIHTTTNYPFYQDLTHQLHATASELQAARNSWPWLSKTLSSIKEAANKREMMSGGGGGGGTGANILRRDSAPASSAATSSSGAGDVRHHPHHHHHSLHSQSRDSFKEAVWYNELAADARQTLVTGLGLFRAFWWGWQRGRENELC